MIQRGAFLEKETKSNFTGVSNYPLDKEERETLELSKLVGSGRD